jgi:hypothetical protein
LRSDPSLSAHAGDLVRLCLAPGTLSAAGIRAFVLLTKPSAPIAHALAARDLLFTEVARVLALTAASPALRSRIAALLQSALAAPACSLDLALGYLVYLLAFCEEPGVAALFRALCEDGAYGALHGALAGAGFVAIVVRDVRGAARGGGERLAALLRVCAAVARSAALRAAFAEARFLAALRDVGAALAPGPARNEFWGAVFAACAPDTAALMGDFVQPAVAVLSEPYDCVSADRVFAVDFIARLVELRAPGAAAAVTQTLAEVLLRLIAQFPHSSNLQGAIFRLITHAMALRELEALVVRQFIPYALVEGSSPVRSAAAAQALRLLARFDADVRAGRVDGSPIRASALDRFRERFLAAYEAIRRSEYGGPTTLSDWADVGPRGRGFR